MSLRGAAPWIVSIAVHAALVLLIPLGAELRSTRAPVPERRVVLSFGDEPAPPPLASAVPSEPAVPAASLPMPSSLPLPSVPELAPVADSLPASAVRIAAMPSGVPTAQEVLDTLPPPLAAASGPAAAAARAAAEPIVQIGWTGSARTVVRSVNPRFPAILSATGQEAEVGARITVTPLGAVIDVEIIQSSGYTEIDAAVQTALRQWFFSRGAGKQNAIGTVTYRFPLEKRD
jgi:TonB family protein